MFKRFFYYWYVLVYSKVMIKSYTTGFLGKKYRS